MGRLVAAKGLVALDDHSDLMRRILERTSADQVHVFSHKDGKLYQLPWKVNPVMLGYDKELFARKGLAPPRTYSEFLTVCEALTEDIDGDGVVDRWGLYVDIKNDWYKRFFDVYTLYLGASRGQTLIKEDQIVLDVVAMGKVLNLFREAFERGFIPRSTWRGAPLGDGRVGMRLISTFSLDTIAHNASPGFTLGVSPIPVPDDHEGPVYTFGDPKNIGIFTTVRDADAASQFLEFMISDRIDKRLIQATHQLPNRDDLLTNPMFSDLFEADPILRSFAAAAGRTRGVDSTPHLVRIFDEMSQLFEACSMFDLIDGDGAAARLKTRAAEIVEFW